MIRMDRTCRFMQRIEVSHARASIANWTQLDPDERRRCKRLCALVERMRARTQNKLASETHTRAISRSRGKVKERVSCVVVSTEVALQARTVWLAAWRAPRGCEESNFVSSSVVGELAAVASRAHVDAQRGRDARERNEPQCCAMRRRRANALRCCNDARRRRIAQRSLARSLASE